MSDTITVYTDGGCSENPGGIGGYAAVIFNGDNPIYLVGSEDNSTNQRMELKAAIVGLKFIERKSSIQLHSDSSYLCNCFKDKWYVKWLENNWRNSKGDAVANKDLWEILLKLVAFHESVEFIKVKGHADNVFNNKCDQLATDIIRFKKEMMGK